MIEVIAFIFVISILLTGEFINRHLSNLISVVRAWFNEVALVQLIYHNREVDIIFIQQTLLPQLNIWEHNSINLGKVILLGIIFTCIVGFLTLINNSSYILYAAVGVFVVGTLVALPNTIKRFNDLFTVFQTYVGIIENIIEDETHGNKIKNDNR